MEISNCPSPTTAPAFDVQDAAKNQGLGFFSMAERARLIGARFEVHSEPQKGTRIDVWVRQQQKARTESPEIVAKPVVQHFFNEVVESS
jgi:signal transduction histidine kinase